MGVGLCRVWVFFVRDEDTTYGSAPVRRGFLLWHGRANEGEANANRMAGGTGADVGGDSVHGLEDAGRIPRTARFHGCVLQARGAVARSAGRVGAFSYVRGGVRQISRPLRVRTDRAA